ncbi:MAG: hypothetical protein ACR2IV_17990 [Bryobacteraceae bacterium]
MKLTWLTLAVFLAVGIARAHGSSLSAEMYSISSRSNIEVIAGSCRGGAAATAFVAGGVSSLCEWSVLNARRSMWGK